MKSKEIKRGIFINDIPKEFEQYKDTPFIVCRYDKYTNKYHIRFIDNKYAWINKNNILFIKHFKCKFYISDVVITKDHRVRGKIINIDDNYYCTIEREDHLLDHYYIYQLFLYKDIIDNFRHNKEVLVRDKDSLWEYALFDKYTENGEYFVCNKIWDYCIPYKHHENLINTNN